jgi:hypothetical protein
VGFSIDIPLANHGTTHRLVSDAGGGRQIDLDAISAQLPALVIRGADQTRHAPLQQAITQLPKREDRLLALM